MSPLAHLKSRNTSSAYKRGMVLSTFPIQRVPVEVCASIFETAVCSEPANEEVAQSLHQELGRRYDLAALESICLVCRAWYKLAITLPALWTVFETRYDTPLERLGLWLSRSRSKGITIVLPIVSIPTFKIVPAHVKGLSAMFMDELKKWKDVYVDCMVGQVPWIMRFGESQPMMLEKLIMKWSGPIIQFPQSCIFSRLKILVLERAACHWVLTIVTNATESLRSLTIARPQPAGSLNAGHFLTALAAAAPRLEKLDLEDITWDDSTWLGPPVHPSTGPEDTELITFPQLKTLSIISTRSPLRLISNLQLPALTILRAGDLGRELGDVFMSLCSHVSTLETLITGLWKKHTINELGLMHLVAKQPKLRTLDVGNAHLSDNFLSVIDPKLDGIMNFQLPPSFGTAETRAYQLSLASGLESLEISGKNVSSSELLRVLRARKNKLKYLRVTHSRITPSERRELRRYVGWLDTEASDGTDSEEDDSDEQ